MLGFLPTRAYRPGTPGATTFLSPLSGTFNYGWDSFGFRADDASLSLKPANRGQLNDEENGLVEKKIRYRLWLKLRVGKALATEETVLTASVAGREVTIESERQSQPLSEASWLLIGCRGFEAEDDAGGFGERNLSTTMGHSTGLIREQCPVW